MELLKKLLICTIVYNGPNQYFRPLKLFLFTEHMSNYLPLIVRDVLTKTGWTENELAVYSTLLEKGAMNLTDLSHETSIAISSLQYVLKQLGLKKMLSKTMLNEKPIYAAANVEQLRKWTKGYCKQYLQFEDTVKKFIDQYDFNPQIYTPKVRFYEGVKGVKQSYRQMLKECKETEMRAIFSVKEGVGPELEDFFLNEYMPSRVKKNIKMKNIALRGPKSTLYKSLDEKHLRETKLVSDDFFPMINTEINLYDDYIHCMSYEENSGFAIIVQDKKMTSLLKGVFKIVWHSIKDDVYMVDDVSDLMPTIQSRMDLYPSDLKEKWKTAKPIYKKTPDNETIIEIMGHEVMSSYALPYEKKLAEIVTQNGGNILNIGYGLGLVDGEIEKLRNKNKVKEHYVIELNKYIADEAKKVKNLNVIHGDWREVLSSMKGKQFEGIIYDGYPLELDNIHKDGIDFIRTVVERNLLTETGILTFYVDAKEKLGQKFKNFLKNLGFRYVSVEKVKVTPPNRSRQIWKEDYFLAPTVKYKK